MAAAIRARPVSPDEVNEKDLTLALARELRDDLVKRGRVRVAMTRNDDQYLTLDERAAVARRLDAGMFVSLHMDSAPNPLARGADRLFTVRRRLGRRGGASGSEGKSGSAGEAADGSVAGDAFRPRDARPDERVRGSCRAAGQQVRRAVRASAEPASLRLVPRPSPRRTRRPYLFEAGYISNADDEVLLRSPEQRSKIALALAQAIETDVAARARR